LRFVPGMGANTVTRNRADGVSVRAGKTRTYTEDNMLRTLFTIGLVALIGQEVLKLAFGLLGPRVALLLWLLWVALQVALVLVVGYFVIRVFSPSTADRIRDTVRGTATK